ncbi:ABC transporter ATP-binding protein [Qingshengfaniella alkalisoli]|uniref:ABC transporter ATP-binding protein n=1 Tax=Qingshengfaniella alkalisoli TaxID=2599296 RepID=A0A5B8J179_9RHOB|nr:ABC transporter ATP-binding protein [Qingshengfaniella alkalisoli]QDY70941.1 ABC transporter ATP-binding protein [Qingshengfaniella alkalisoli]
MTALSVRNLRKSFGALQVTDDVNLDVTEGSLHALIGPNGAGKTTLIHQLCGQLGPDDGTVSFFGTDVTDLDMPHRARLGLARSFQITSVLPRFTVRDNVALAVQARSGSSFRFFRPAKHERALNDQSMAALTDVGLTDRANDLAGALSHGEQRQLEIAIALATRPRMLLLDEPLAGTGPEEADALVDLLLKLKGQLSILLVEHDMNAVFALADKISVLVYGRLIATGPGADIRRNREVREAYLGEDAS